MEQLHVEMITVMEFVQKTNTIQLTIL